VEYGNTEERKISPGEKSIGRIPRVRTGLLRAEDWVVDVEIESLIGAGSRASVSAHDRIGVAKVVTKRDLKGVVVVLASVAENEIAGSGGIARVVDEPIGAMPAEEFRFQVDGPGEFLLQTEAPVQESRGLERIVVDGERGREWASCGDAIGGLAVGIDGEEKVGPAAGIRAGDQEEWGRVVDDADSGRELGVAGVVENIGSGKTWREYSLVDDSIPIEANPRFNEQAIGHTPAIFQVGADFGVRLLMGQGGSESGVTSTGKVPVLRRSEADIGGLKLGDTRSEKRNRSTIELGVVGDLVEIRADLEIVTAVPIARCEI